jgi:hypothetical protein
MAGRKTAFRIIPLGGRRWAAYHVSRDPAFYGPHQMRLQIKTPRVWRGFVVHKVVLGRSPLEALERLKRQLAEGTRP